MEGHNYRDSGSSQNDEAQGLASDTTSPLLPPSSLSSLYLPSSNYPNELALTNPFLSAGPFLASATGIPTTAAPPPEQPTAATDNFDMADSTESLMASESSESKSGRRKKKAVRACNHCQKAHLTCDDARPCLRCVKRNLGATCADGARKKAKYLRDTPSELLATVPPAGFSAASAASSPSSPTSGPTAPVAALGFGGPALMTHPHGTQPLATVPLDLLHPGGPPLMPAVHGLGQQQPLHAAASQALPHFSSEASSLEYAFLSSMLPSTADSSPLGGFLSPPGLHGLSAQYPGAPAPMSMQQQPQHHYLSHQQQQQQQQQQHHHHNQHHHHHHHSHPRTAAAMHGGGSDLAALAGSTGAPMLATGMAMATMQHPSAIHAWQSQAMQLLGTSPSMRPMRKLTTPQAVYASVTAPYNYTEGYHYLVEYIKSTMGKDEMTRICRAMYKFRPSFIALVMGLTEEDLIFAEKCFQRTLLEYEKLISFSGTPTVVWRRTGEIALVGKEFSLLTMWTKDQIFAKKTYIWELMDNESAVSYWELFAAISFDNSQSSMLSTCTLLSPTRTPIPCAFSFTIKKDTFDIPLAIVGNFLPILS
ncbi:hypothetical protein BC828DRAFT_406030 [Blastocladiella britannica]|nr:hypothetical protein BC828DRAFT_406030 [Blastocladiella britannica]